MKLKTILWMLCASLMVFATVSSALADDWIISGDSVYMNDTNAYISVSPHTITGSEDIKVELTSKTYTGFIDVVFGFDTTYARPLNAYYYNPQTLTENVTRSTIVNNVLNIETTSDDCEIGEEYNNLKRKVTINTTDDNQTYYSIEKVFCFDTYENPETQTYIINWTQTYITETTWQDVGSHFESVSYEFGGATDWWYKKNFYVEAGTTYKLKTSITTPINMSEGKYWVAFKPSGETMSEAVASGHLYYLDPWWNVSYDKKRPIENVWFDDLAFSLNGTGGWNGSIIWFNPSHCGHGNMSIYYEGANDSNYAIICNDTTKMAFETEGGGVNWTPRSVYRATNNATYHVDPGINDSSIGENDGTKITDAKIQTSGGIFGDYYNFKPDSTNYINTGAENINDDTVISLWYKNNETGTIGGRIIGSRNGNNYLMLTLNTVSLSDNDLDIMYRNDAAAYYNLRVNATPHANLTDGDWHSIIFQFNQTEQEWRIYVDGEHCNDNLSYSDGATVSQKLPYMMPWGAYNNAGGIGTPLDGQGDELRFIYDTLNDSEIAHLANFTTEGRFTLGAIEAGGGDTYPNVNITTTNHTVTTDVTPEIRFNVTYVDTANNCTLYFNNTQYGTDTTIVNNTLESITVNSSLDFGRYDYYVNCTNGSHAGSSPNNNMTINRTQPTISLDFPTEGWSYAKNYINTTITVTDRDESHFACELWVNGTEYNNTDVANNTATSLMTTNLTNNGYQFVVNCSTSNGSKQTTQNYNVTIAVGTPSVEVTNPLNDTNITVNSTTYTFNVTNNEYFPMNCSLFFNGTKYGMNGTTQNNTLTNITTNTTLLNGTYWTFVSCGNHTYGNSTNQTLTVNLSGVKKPEVTIHTPLPNSIHIESQPNITFNYTFTQDNLNCSLWINDTKYGINESVTNNTRTNFTVNSSLHDGLHLMFIGCHNGTLWGNSTTQNMTIAKNTPPDFLNITNPRNNTLFYDTTPTITFNFTDLQNATLPCTIYFNDTNVSSNASVNNNTLTNLTTSTLDYGNYDLLLSCGANNITNITYNVTLGIYDKWAWIDKFNRTNSGDVGNGWVEGEAAVNNNATIYNYTMSLIMANAAGDVSATQSDISSLRNHTKVKIRYRLRDTTAGDVEYVGIKLNDNSGENMLNVSFNTTHVFGWGGVTDMGYSTTGGYVNVLLDLNHTNKTYTVYSNDTYAGEGDLDSTYTGWDSIVIYLSDADPFNTTFDAVWIGEGYGELNVNLTNKTGGILTNFSTNITHTITGYTRDKTTINGTMRFNNLPNGTYDVTITPESGYGTFTNETDILIGHTKNNTYTAPQSWVQMVFLNETNQDNMTGINISVEIFGENHSYNASTTTGLFNLTLPDDVYRIRYSPESYGVRNYFFTQQSNQTNLTLYCIHNNTYSTISYTIYDETESYMKGVYVDIQKKFADTNSFSTVDMSQSDYGGAGSFSIDKSVAYRILVWENGEVIWQSAHDKITLDDIEIRIQTGEDAFEGFIDLFGVPTSLSFNNETLIYSLTWNDPTDIVAAGCIKIYRLSAMSGRERINFTCLNNSVGSITVNLTKYGNSTGHYIAEAWLDTNTNGSWFSMRSLEAMWGAFDMGKFGVLLAFIIVITTIFVSLPFRNPIVTGIMTIAGLAAVGMLGLMPIGWLALMYIIVPIAVLMARRSEG